MTWPISGAICKAHARGGRGAVDAVDLFDDAGPRGAVFAPGRTACCSTFPRPQLDDARAGAACSIWREAAGVAARRDAMFCGREDQRDRGARGAAHGACGPPDGPVEVDGARRDAGGSGDAGADGGVCRRGPRRVASAGAGGAYTDVVNIGIGGSDLGPAMATLALAPYHDGPRVHYVSNVDGAHIHDTLQGLDPKRTLVIVASKTFTTIETMTNADTARGLDGAARSRSPAAQFAALSSAVDQTAAFGIDPSRVFGFEDWVGGRYSLWGPIGLGLMLAVGPERFAEFLAGAQAMDRHFRTRRLAENLPVLLALVGHLAQPGAGPCDPRRAAL